MEDIRKFFANYGGIVIGILVAILVLCTGLYQLIVAIILIGLGAYIGNYVQKNKYEVKEKLKNFIDKL